MLYRFCILLIVIYIVFVFVRLEEVQGPEDDKTKLTFKDLFKSMLWPIWAISLLFVMAFNKIGPILWIVFKGDYRDSRLKSWLTLYSTGLYK